MTVYVGPPPPLRHSPPDILSRILYITGFAVQAILGIDLQPLSTMLVSSILIDTCSCRVQVRLLCSQQQSRYTTLWEGKPLHSSFEKGSHAGISAMTHHTDASLGSAPAGQYLLSGPA